MRNISQKKLNKILKKHELWLKGEGGEQANLRYANLGNAILSYADLRHADLSYTNLLGADLRGANLRGVNLRYSNLEGIKTDINTIGYSLACPEEGSFIGYKKANGCIVKLLILENSKRSSATTVKCRCDKAKVLEIKEIETGRKVKRVSSNYDFDFIYEVGKVVTVDDFDEDRWSECSTGIHFFMNKENALNY